MSRQLLAAVLAAIVLPCSLTGAPVRFDFNAPGSPTQAGWVAADLGNGSNGTISIATAGVGTVTVDSRDRVAANTNDSAADIGNNDMWRDFVFANGSTSARPGSGLAITVTGLLPNATYPFRVWAFDDLSDLGRAADWSAGSGSARLTFPTSPDPTSLASYTVTINGTTDGSGSIVITGTVSTTSPNSTHNVFVNGLEIGNYFGDLDGDGMQDSFELDIVEFDPLDTLESVEDVLPGDDFDGDGSTNENEEDRGTNPTDPDTDGDTVPDGAEDGGGVWVDETRRGTDPLDGDSDKDGLSDGVENRDLAYDQQNPLTQPGSDPNQRDTDGDGASDYREVAIDDTDPTDNGSVFDPLAGAVALFDFNAVGSPTQAGWTGAELGSGSNGTVSVSTAVIAGTAAVTLDSRDRATLINTDGIGADTAHADLWRDFVFALNSFSTNPGSGLRVTLTGLLPLTTYPIRIWAFDEDSNGGRSADWGVSGEPASATLTFPSSPDPSALLDYLISFDATTDAAGQLLLDGIVASTAPNTSHNVFVSALVVGAPAQSVLPEITDFVYNAAAGSATVTWSSAPGLLYSIDASEDLAFWGELEDSIPSGGSSTSFTESGLTPEQITRFYRVRISR